MGPDKTGACLKCGLMDHIMKDFKKPDDRCLSCELAGLPKASHKPGSAACAVRKLASGSKIPRDD